MLPPFKNDQYIVYKLVPSAGRPGKMDKLPIDARTGSMPTKGSGANSIWTSFSLAMAAANNFGVGYGVGYSFAESDPYFFLDIDNCFDPLANDWSALAKHLLNAFPGAYVEVSQSGKGLHIMGTGTPPPHACKNTPLGLELYHTDRFVALTGDRASGSAETRFDYVLPWLVENYFPLESATISDWTTEPVADWRGPNDDDTLLTRAMKSKPASSAFGNKITFAEIYEGDVEALSRTFPDPESDRGYDASSADSALAQRLAFWTGKNCERILRLMQGSALNRPKWEREDYLPNTIAKVVARQVDVLQDKPLLTIEYDTPDGTADAKPDAIMGSSYANIEQQLVMFDRCAYVLDAHKVLIPGGNMLRPEQFRVAFGGFTFPLDPGNERQTRNAWECFTETQAWRAPRVDTTCFRPDLPFATIVSSGGVRMANTYWPIETPKKAGDVSPFLTHINKVLPDARDQQILISYMAACVQHKGTKFQWAPLLQGVEGNGKTLFTRCVAFAIGDRYVHFPKASQIASQFNDWMYGTLFIGVEDIYVADSQREVIEELKPMITGVSLEIEGKGETKATRGVCCNFMLNSNHKDGIRKTRNDRRFAAFYTAQQNKEDLVRDGMTGEYFRDLYRWLQNGGFEAVNHFLQTYEIADEFNPATGQIAPLTSSTEEALAYGLGRAEQYILEAIEREESGFRGGWVSSMAVDALLERIGEARRVPPNKRRDLMLNLGYDWHPGLTNGRVNNTVLPDGGKPRLFIYKDSPHRGILKQSDIASLYANAQNAG